MLPKTYPLVWISKFKNVYTLTLCDEKLNMIAKVIHFMVNTILKTEIGF